MSRSQLWPPRCRTQRFQLFRTSAMCFFCVDVSDGTVNICGFCVWMCRWHVWLLQLTYVLDSLVRYLDQMTYLFFEWSSKSSFPLVFPKAAPKHAKIILKLYNTFKGSRFGQNRSVVTLQVSACVCSSQFTQALVLLESPAGPLESQQILSNGSTCFVW